MANTPSLTGKDLLLMLLYSPGTESQVNEPIKGRTRITKMIFIFQKEVYKDFRLDISQVDFKDWNFGPWSEELFQDLDFFKNIGFLSSVVELIAENKESSVDISSEEADEFEMWQKNFVMNDNAVETYSQEVFSLLDLGVEYTEKNLYKGLTDNQKKILQEFKKKFNSISLFTILRYVYSKYPETIKNSKIKDKILP